MSLPKYSEEKKKVVVGDLPEDFLRVNGPNQATSINGSNQATSMNGRPQATQINQQPIAACQYTNQITICVIQAQLNKNYGLTKMDPYVRIRIGHSVFDTTTDVKGGKCPKWNKTITSYLPDGIKTIYIEVFDEGHIMNALSKLSRHPKYTFRRPESYRENMFQPDEIVAHADYIIPDEAFQGKFLDEWIPLSGKLGADKEGSINITLSIKSMPYMPTVMPAVQPVMVIQQQPTFGAYPYYANWNTGTPVTTPILYQQPMQNPNYASQPVVQAQPYRPSEQEIKQVQEMFPTYDKEVIIGVLETCQGNKEQAISSLLSLG